MSIKIRDDFKAFVGWVDVLAQAPAFDSNERDNKLELSQRFLESIWVEPTFDALVTWMGRPPNNIVGWRSMRELADNAGDALIENARLLLADGDLAARIEHFCTWLDEVTTVSAGAQTTMASVLLMGSDPAKYPPYKTEFIREAMMLAGRKSSGASPSERYLDFLRFCDDVVAAAPDHSLDRLDVQSACWIMARWESEEVAELLPDQHAEFEAWREGESPGAIEQVQPQGHSVRWWVNQGATYREEHDGSYIWAPQKTKKGHPVNHHTAVSTVQTGDKILHYSKGAIRAVGTAIADGYESDRPGELSESAWEKAGYRVDVRYRDLEPPIQLSEVSASIRGVDGGPFDAGGAVKQGYLFELPESVREELARLTDGADDGIRADDAARAWAIYVGKSSVPNLEFSMPLGRWGWKRSLPNYSELAPGDTLLFAVGYTGGSPRTSTEDFAKHNLERLIVCEATSVMYEDDEPFWPDERDDVSYPHRVKLRVMEEIDGASLAETDKRFGGPVAEAFRMSAINQGRAEQVTISGRPQVEPRPIDEVVEAFSEACKSSGLSYGERHDTLVRSFVTALATKPFVILTGLSGSGKTRLAQAFGHWLGAVKVVPVRPDWTSPDSLLGFENALSEQVDGRHAWNAPETLRFILEARDNSSQPYVLLLDEMNLAHVERYFADVLSGMESHEPVVPDLVEDDGGIFRQRSGSNGSFELPRNLFVVGTVNIDETTYMFSPKVLDRANTFEFRVETADLVAATADSALGSAEPGLAAGFLQAAVSSAPTAPLGFDDWLKSIHALLTTFDREFGHRTFQEALRFAGLLKEAGESDPLVALDLQIAQKILPRLHGSRRELSELLDQLGAFCCFGPDKALHKSFDCAGTTPDDSIALPLSFGKLRRMARKLRDNHFVSFAE